MFSIFQIAFAVLITLALMTGRPHPRVGAAILVNFIGSVALSKAGLSELETFRWMGILDICAALSMLGCGWRGSVAAACYGAMATVYVVGVHLDTTVGVIYSVIEGLGVIALAVTGGMDRGIRFLHRSIGSLYHRTRYDFRRSHDNLGGVDNGGEVCAGAPLVSEDGRAR
jgi:hypothetical protein